MQHAQESSALGVKRAQRVVVLGVTGSGKTTTAARAARYLSAKHVELDALYWGPNWTPVDIPVFRERVAEAIADVACWVTDGGYASHVWDITWKSADTILWLDYPLTFVMARLLRRSVRRIVSRELLWSENRESFRKQFLSGESLFVWALKTHGKYRRTYPAHFGRPELSHVQVVRARSSGAAASWLRALEAAS
jgi:shikimate kinase